MTVTEIEQHTRAAFPEWNEADLRFDLIEKGGSGRIFVRVSGLPEGGAVIAMFYLNDRADNKRFAPVTDFLNRHEIPAPEVIRRNDELNLLWVEDLGEIDLGTLEDSDWDDVRAPAYREALKAVFRLHSILEAEAPEDLPELEPPFDDALYTWEQEYFLEQYVARFLSPETASSLAASPEMKALRDELAKLPRSLLHRDFQSTNVMMPGGEAHLIDYQGLRWGVPEYDLASMVYDPYITFSETERDELVDYYFSLKEEAGHETSREAFQKRLNQCATQRLMQAMGAYGFLSEVKGKSEFLQHIPAAAARLVALSEQDGGLPPLKEVLQGVA
ncbi:MAG: phosphotransferase [Verrucomicrobiales bacterium]|nr:phosphotransferase [Verrucomicrobiales bacterium]